MTDRRHAFTLGDVVRENARSLPTTEALVCGDARVTFRDLEGAVNRTAAVLIELGVGPGDRVAWVGPSCHRTIEALFACAKAAAIFAPLNWRQSDDELTWTLGAVAPKVVLLWPEFGPSSDVIVSGAPDATVVLVDHDYDERVAQASSDDVSCDEDDELPVLELFTAAFSGRPRGALLTHRGIVLQDVVFMATGQVQGYGEVYLASGPMFHIGVLLKLFANLHFGGKSVILAKVDAEDVCRAVSAERCTSAFLFTPTIGEVVVVARGGKYDLSSLHTVPGRPPVDVADEWYSMTSCVPPTKAGVIGYGQTETLGMVTFEDLPPGGVGIFGRPSPLVALRVFDEDGNEVPDGEVGELAVRGPQLMARYHDETEAESGPWHRTHDLGRRELDGTVSFLGPKLDLIKTGMENVYPAEVEGVLRTHPSIKDACVIGIPDAVWGESVRAVVEPVEGVEIDEAEVIAYVRSRIASYKKPKSVISVPALPRTGQFVDRDEVKRAWAH